MSPARNMHALHHDRYNVYFTVRMYSGVYTSPRGCRIWWAYQAIIVQFLLIFVEGLLMQRSAFSVFFFSCRSDPLIRNF